MYKKSELIKLAEKAIIDNNLLFIDEVVSYLPCSRATFYNYELDKLDNIKELLFDNKVKIKNTLQKKWYKSGNPTLQLALYKIICSKDEFLRLANSRLEFDITTKGQSLKPEYDFSKLSDEEFQTILEIQKKLISKMS